MLAKSINMLQSYIKQKRDIYADTSMVRLQINIPHLQISLLTHQFIYVVFCTKGSSYTKYRGGWR